MTTVVASFYFGSSCREPFKIVAAGLVVAVVVVVGFIVVVFVLFVGAVVISNCYLVAVPACDRTFSSNLILSLFLWCYSSISSGCASPFLVVGDIPKNVTQHAKWTAEPVTYMGWSECCTKWPSASRGVYVCA